MKRNPAGEQDWF